MKTPKHYRAPLRSRAKILAWLVDRAESNPRKAYGLFCYNVKLHNLNTDFAHLCELARNAGELAPDASPRYLAAVEAVYNDKSEAVFEAATEAARESVVNDDTHRMLWDGSGAIAEWTFDGRSGGWLVLKEFGGADLSGPLQYTDAAGFLSDMPYPWLRRLYRFLIQCDHDFRNPESEVEYQAAFNLFANFARRVETDKQAAEREAAEAREQAEREHWEARDTATV